MRQRTEPCPHCGGTMIVTEGWDANDYHCPTCQQREVEEAAQARDEREMRAQGYHRCPDGVWRMTPSNGMFDGLCGVCESYEPPETTT